MDTKTEDHENTKWSVGAKVGAAAAAAVGSSAMGYAAARTLYPDTIIPMEVKILKSSTNLASDSYAKAAKTAKAAYGSGTTAVLDGYEKVSGLLRKNVNTTECQVGYDNKVAADCASLSSDKQNVLLRKKKSVSDLFATFRS